MVRPILLGSTLGLALTAPVFAGPCTQRIAELEKSVTAKQEGAGPALSNAPHITGSTGQPSGGSVTAQTARENEAMGLLHQAKELDQQGKEECMQIVKRVEGMASPGTK